MVRVSIPHSMHTRTLIIAEVKPMAPDWKSRYSWDHLFKVANHIGDRIAIHTDERWGGSLELISAARARTKKHILAKGIHGTDKQLDEVFARGADSALVVGRLPNRHEEKCLVEPYTIEEFLEIPEDFKIVWNSRDIKALLRGTRPQERVSFSEVRALRPRAWICQASNIKSVEDVHPGANAVLVGTHLVEFAQSLYRA
jgi:indole-3-glycerol phosphate synthase